MLQPFKYITVVMKDRTNHGVTAFHNENGVFMDRFELAEDLRCHPVTLGDDGTGEPFTDTNKATKKIIGVLMESFNKTNAQHKVLVHGISPMPAKADVKAGRYVYWDTTEKKLTITKTDDTPFIGRALTSAKDGGSMVDVLIS